MKKIIAIGLMALSFNVMAEGKYATKFPLSGVKAVETFGMTLNEKQKWEENKEMFNMCSEEKIKSGTDYNKNTDNKSYVSIMSFKYGSTQNWYLDNEKLYYRKRHHLQDDITGTLSGLTRGTLKETSSRTRSGIVYTTRFYEITYNVKTENYNWCVENGYPVFN